MNLLSFTHTHSVWHWCPWNTKGWFGRIKLFTFFSCGKKGFKVSKKKRPQSQRPHWRKWI